MRHFGTECFSQVVTSAVTDSLAVKGSYTFRISDKLHIEGSREPHAVKGYHNNFHANVYLANPDGLSKYSPAPDVPGVQLARPELDGQLNTSLSGVRIGDNPRPLSLSSHSPLLLGRWQVTQFWSAFIDQI